MRKPSKTKANTAIHSLNQHGVLQVTGLFIGLLLTISAFATPAGGVIDGGAAIITHPDAVTTSITQTSDRAAINWRSFDVKGNETVNFIQPNAGSITLNRVTGGLGASEIYGRINANGHVWILNPEGVHFGPGSHVDVAGVLASTYNLSTDNFMQGHYQFEPFAGDYDGRIFNEGEIKVSSLAAMLSHDVENAGIIHAEIATVMLGANPTFVLDVYGDDTINIAVSDALLQKKAMVSHSGEIYADGGQVYLSLAQAENAVGNVINVSGEIHANTVTMNNGVIVLSAGANSDVNVTGNLSAKNGKIHVLGETIKLTQDAILDVSGENAGEVLVGGDYLGQGDTPHADYVLMGPNARINASAYENGDGGKVILWSDKATHFYGHIDAKGGSNSGDGGLIETSSHGYLNPAGTVDASSATGVAGLWLLDPYSVEIVAGTANSFGSFNDADPDTWTPSATSTVGAGNIKATLESGTDVMITTGDMSVEDGSNSSNITLLTELTYGSDKTLSFYAHNDIDMTGGFVINTGAGDLVLRADIDGNGKGAVSPTTNVTLNGGALEIYYNSTDFPTPTSFTATNVTPTAYMLINNLDQLQAMNSNLDGYYALGKNIDAVGTELWNVDADTNTYLGFDPVGVFNNLFTGKFDGQGFSIKNLYINRSNEDGVGLFGFSFGATIKNVGLEDVSILGHQYVSGLLGYSNQATIINNAYVTGAVQGTSYVGGLVGYLGSGSTIESAYTAGQVIGEGVYVGGLAASTYQSNIYNSYTTGQVTGATTDVVTGEVTKYNYVGGLVGNSSSTIIKNSFSTSDVIGGEYVGGLLGHGYKSTIENAYATGTVEGSNYVGGLVGRAHDLIVKNTYATGDVNSDRNVGGLVGYALFSMIANAYATGLVTGSNALGGLIGEVQQTTLENLYWDKDTTGQDLAVGSGFVANISQKATGLTTEEMMTQASLENFEFANEHDGTTLGNWIMLNNLNAYPRLQFEGKMAQIFGIKTVEDLQLMTVDLTQSYVLHNNIDASATEFWNVDSNKHLGFDPIGASGVKPFTGKFDGQGFSIENLYINRPTENYVGLFGASSGALIENVGLEEGSFLGKDFVGGLVGFSNTTSIINNAYVTGAVQGINYVGGLVGNAQSASIQNSYASGEVSGVTNVGGLVGSAQSTSIQDAYASGEVTGADVIGGLVGFIDNSTILDAYASGVVTGRDYIGGLAGDIFESSINNAYASGDVTGGNFVGGLIGQSDSSDIDSAYAAGSVTVPNGGIFVGGLIGNYISGSLSKLYWDLNTTGQARAIGNNVDSDPAGVNGRTTAQMMRQSTFAGWDFNTVWGINENVSYPFFIYQNIPPVPVPPVPPVPPAPVPDAAVLPAGLNVGQVAAFMNPFPEKNEIHAFIVEEELITILSNPNSPLRLAPLTFQPVGSMAYPVMREFWEKYSELFYSLQLPDEKVAVMLLPMPAVVFKPLGPMPYAVMQQYWEKYAVNYS